MEGGNTKKVLIWLVICALVIQMVPVSITGDTWVQTTQEDFEGGETWNTNVTLSPGNVTLEPSPTDWVKAQGNPVLDVGPSGSWDASAVYSPSVVFHNGLYHMWYSGEPAPAQIGLSTSPDGYTWTRCKDNPIITPQAWFSQAAWSTVLWDEPSGEFKMWFTGYDSVSKIGYANSSDGINWNVFFIPVFNSTQAWEGGYVQGPHVLGDSSIGFKMWYAGGLSPYAIGYAESPDGRTWTPYFNNPILQAVEPWEGSVVRDPTVLFNSGEYMMWYRGGSSIGYANSPDGINWTKLPSNPILSPGAAGNWDSSLIEAPDVIIENGVYRMWYTGESGNVKIGHSISNDGVNWTKRAVNPVLDIGEPGSWDDYWTYMGSVLKEGDIYKMWYTGCDGTTHGATWMQRIGYAESIDGIYWEKNTSNPVLELGSSDTWDDGAIFSCGVINDEGTYKIWYTGHDGSRMRIGYASSNDGIIWVKYDDPTTTSQPYQESDPVMNLASPSDWDYDCMEPRVIKDGSTYKMWYTGWDGSHRRVGLAISDDGINWTKSTFNPVFVPDSPGKWDNDHVTAGFVQKESNLYEMWYTGNDNDFSSRIGYATSFDGINWTRSPLNPVVDKGKAGTWDRSAIHSPSIIRDVHQLKMWYSGWDGSNHRIGYATAAYDSRFIKEPSNPILDLGPAGSWDDERAYGAFIRFENGKYRMWYSGYDGSLFRIGYAESTDGLEWKKYNDNPIMDVRPGTYDEDGVIAPYILFENGEYHMWYTGGFPGLGNTQIGYANSSDGYNWTRPFDIPVLDGTGGGSWDDGDVAGACVINDSGVYKMWYGGEEWPVGTWRIGYAVSNDGINWIKPDLGFTPGTNIINLSLGPDDNQGGPYVLKESGFYQMWYNARVSGVWQVCYATSLDGLNWTKSTIIPVIPSGEGGSWDDEGTGRSNVINESGELRMWYDGWDGSYGRSGHAISTDGINWTKRAVNPVLDVGETGEWDDWQIAVTSVIKKDGIYKMWYEGRLEGGTLGYDIGYAESLDGFTWDRSSSNPVLTNGSSGSWDDFSVMRPAVIYDEDESIYKMWYSGSNDGASSGKRIGYAASLDGIEWNKNASNPVLDLGSPGSWDDTEIQLGCVIKENSVYKMWYSGYHDAWRIGHAESLDGITWQKSEYNPILDIGISGEWEETDVRFPYIINDDGMYKMWYVGVGEGGTVARAGFAMSIDGINWTKSKLNPILVKGVSGSWDSNGGHVCSVMRDGPIYKMWFVGMDSSSTYYRIGYSTSQHTSTGTYESSIYDSGYSGTFWNTISWSETLLPNTLITLSIRTGDTPIPDSTWTNWTEEIYDSFGSIISQPRTRYIQYRATLISLDAKYTLILEDVTINYDLNAASPPTLTSPSNDLWTTNNTPTFTWTYDDPNGDMQSAFEVQIDDDSMFGSVDYSNVTISSSLEYWDSVMPIADGTWFWHVRTMDEYGLWSDWSEKWSINIDTTPPPPPIDIAGDPDYWAQDSWFDINWTNPYDFSGISNVVYMKFDSPPTSNSDFSYEVTKPFTVSATKDMQTLYVWLMDTLGNCNYKNNATVILYRDTVPPEVFYPIADPSGWTTNTQPQIAFFTTDTPSGIDYYEVSIDGGGFTVQTGPYTLLPLSDGIHNITVRAYDKAGNYRDGFVEVYIDTTPPAPPTDVIVIPDTWTNSNSFIINWTNPIETDTSGIKTGVWYKIGSPPTSNSDGTWEAGKPITISSLEGGQTIYIWLEDNLGNTNYLNYRSVILYLDTVPPSISHTPPASGVVDEPITIDATITDNVAVKSATLYYRKTGDTNWSSVSMTQDGDSYSAEIPTSAVTMAGVQYYISASDEVNTASYPSLAPTNNYFNLTIRDVSPPTISHTPVSNGTAGQAITISATITDNVGVTGATLYYKIKGTPTWSSIPMTQNVNVFSADIPASDVTTDGVEYYIFATDDIFNTTSPGVNPQTAPYEITVTKEPKLDDKDVLFVPSWLWLLLVLFIVLVLIVLFLSRRRGEEMEVGPIAEEEPIFEEVGEIIPEEEPQPELPEETELPGEESKLTEEVEELEAPEIPKEEKIPSLPSQDISDDEIFENIKKKYEEGKLSKETFEDFKKRYGKE